MGCMSSELKLNRIYRHYKGDEYLVLEVATHSETGEEMVVYRALYGDGKLWVRPLAMFFDELDDGKVARYGQKRRFELVERTSVKMQGEG